MKWPFGTKQKTALQTKGASMVFGMGALRTMQTNFETLASEGYSTNPIVHGCVEKIAKPLALVEIQAFTRAKDGSLVKQKNHPILKLLNRPNPMATKGEFIGELVRDLMIAGDAFAYGAGIDPMLAKPKPPTELYVFKPNTVKVLKGDNILPKAYEYRSANNISAIYPVNQINGMSAVLHKKTYNPLDRTMGLSPMVAAAFGVDIRNEGQRWNLKLLQNEGRPSGALVVKGADGKAANLSEEQYQRLKEQLEQQMSGAQNAGKPLLLEGGLEWQELSVSAKDMDHKENMNTAARDIALAYDVPPMLLGIPGDATYSNLSEAKLALWTDAILPTLDSVLCSLNNWLAPLYDDGVELWYDEETIQPLEALRKQKAERIEASTSLSMNEKRQAMGYDDVAGGDVILVDGSKLPLELIGEMGLNEPGSPADSGK